MEMDEEYLEGAFHTKALIHPMAGGSQQSGYKVR